MWVYRAAMAAHAARFSMVTAVPPDGLEFIAPHGPAEIGTAGTRYRALMVAEATDEQLAGLLLDSSASLSAGPVVESHDSARADVDLVD